MRPSYDPRHGAAEPSRTQPHVSTLTEAGSWLEPSRVPHPGDMLPSAVHIVLDPAEHGPVNLLLRRHVEAVAGNQVQHLQGGMEKANRSWHSVGPKDLFPQMAEWPAEQHWQRQRGASCRCWGPRGAQPLDEGSEGSCSTGAEPALPSATLLGSFSLPPFLCLKLLQCLTLPISISELRQTTLPARVPSIFHGMEPGALAVPSRLASPAKG